MSRPVSDYTLAIRNLLNKDKDITHLVARPILAKAGFPIVEAPPERKTAAYAQAEGHCKDVSDLEAFEKAAKGCNFDPKTLKAVILENKQRLAFKDERNKFDVVKFQWGKNRNSSVPTPSRKPASKRGRPAKVLVVAQAESTEDALALVEKHGGLAAAQSHVDSLKNEAEALSKAIEAVVEFKKRMEKAA